MHVVWPSYTVTSITHLLPLALLLILCTCNNTDGNKLVLFFSIALYYGDTYIVCKQFVPPLVSWSIVGNLYTLINLYSFCIYISYYTSFRAIQENIAWVRGCIFTSPKNEWKYSPHEYNIPYCTETSVIRDLFYIPISMTHAYNKCFNTVCTFANHFRFSLPCVCSVYSFFVV